MEVSGGGGAVASSPATAAPAGRPGRFGPPAFLCAVFLAHTLLLTAYGHLRPERLRIIGPDPVAYYAYFHSVYFDRDLDFANQYDDLGGGFAGYERTSTGLATNHSSCGPAIALAPFWIGADMAARAGPWEANGAATPYHVAGFIGLGFYGWAALMALGVWAGREFGAWPGAMAAATAWGATPLLYYSYPLTLEPHAVGAFGATLLLVVAQRRVAGRGLDGALVGAALGWAMLCRWQNFLFVAYPFALSLKRIAETHHRRGAIAREFRFWLAIALAAAAVFAPQMIAWHAMYDWFLGAPQQEGYFTPDRLAPLKVLFSMHNGLFIWTPAAAIGVAGLFFAPRAARWTAVSLAAIFLAQLAVNSSVWDWFGAWGFGSRRFTECAAIFAFGWGALFSLVWTRRRWRLAPIAAGALLVAFTQAFLFQFYFHLIKWNGPLTAHELIGDKFHLGKSYYRRLSVEEARRSAEAGDFERAWEMLNDAMRLDPRHEDIYLEAGLVSEMTGNLIGALFYFDAALGLRPGDSDLLKSKERVLAKMNAP